MKMKLARFNKPRLLKRIQRDLLGAFFARFREDLAARGLSLPAPELADTDYYAALTRLLLAPEDLPDRLNEALFAIDEMAGPRGREQLELAAARSGLEPPAESTNEDLALRLWLAAPALLARLHNRQRLLRLSAFEYFAGENSTAPPAPPGPAAVNALAAGLDKWFARHQRGRSTARIEIHEIDGEWWFLVRHGDTFARTPAVEEQRTEVLHFRPEKDDVVVYSPERDEIRINARTRGERELYVGQLGLCLRGRADYFRRRRTYTLEPLRDAGPGALDTQDIEGIRRITLRQIEIALDNSFHEVTTRAADDLFRCAAANCPGPEPIPRDGVITRAAFELWFADSAKPRLVQVRPPNTLKLSRHCDARCVSHWLSRRGFRVVEPRGLQP